MTKLQEFISNHNTLSLLNLAKSLRKQEDTHHIAIYLLVETAVATAKRNYYLPLKKKTSQPSLLSEMVPEIAIDIDDVLEALSYYIKQYGTKKKIPNALKKGLAKSLADKGSLELLECLHKRKKGLTLYDAMKILHPTLNN
jgi:hypothetical protein